MMMGEICLCWYDKQYETIIDYVMNCEKYFKIKNSLRKTTIVGKDICFIIEAFLRYYIIK